MRITKHLSYSYEQRDANLTFWLFPSIFGQDILLQNNAQVVYIVCSRASAFLNERMQNQAAVEALYSATFVEDYLDCVENLPNELQRHLTRLREFDLIQYSEFLKDLDNLVSAFEKETTASGQRNVLSKIQLGLIAAQDIGDDKLVTVQSMSDLIENKARQLEHDSKNLDFDKDDASGHDEAPSKSEVLPKAAPIKKDKEAKDKGGPGGVKKRTNKLKERREDRDDDEISTVSNRSGGASRPRGSQKRQGVKRKASAGKRSSQADKDDSDREVDLSNLDIDPDEPRYCLCDQVSYGEMIGCDNDLCPIEWFHFNCVQLSSKPKGKWYCPKCRGDKQTVMKPRAQFLKELAIFNKEREAKMMKQNS